MFQSRNIYDNFIILVIVSLIFGTIQVSLITQSVLVGFMCLPFAMKELYGSLKDLKFKPLILFITCWLLYAIFSVLWTVDEKRGLPDLWILSWLMIIFLALFHASANARQPIRSFMIGWICLLSCTFPIAIWEIATNSHLPGVGDFNVEAAEDFYGNNQDRLFAAVTYQNLNSYTTLLCLALPLIMSSIFWFDQKVIPSIVTILTIVIILINASRAAMVCVIIDAIIFLVFYYKSKFRYKTLITMLLIIIIGMAVFSYGLLVVEQLLGRFDDVDSFMQDEGRWDMISLGIQLIIESLGFGWGVGGMNEAYAKTGFWLHYAHNFVIEFILQYGLILFVAFFILFWKAICVLLKNQSIPIKLYGWSLLGSFITLVVIDDTYLTRTFFWCYLATIFSISASIENSNNK